LDDGVVDTLGSVGATSGVHTSTSINARTARESPRAALREACQQTRVTHGDGNRPQQHDWLGNIRELQNVIERAIISLEIA